MTITKHLIVVVMLAFAVITAQAQSTESFQALPSVELPPELDRVLRDYEQAWQAADLEALAALFTEDGFVPSRYGWVQGREAIQQTYTYAGNPLYLRALDYAVQDSVGFIVGAYNYKEESELDKGNFVLALRRGADGTWLIVADLDKGNRP